MHAHCTELSIKQAGECGGGKGLAGCVCLDENILRLRCQPQQQKQSVSCRIVRRIEMCLDQYSHSEPVSS